MRVDVAVVGAGAVGVSVAWLLTEAGVRSLALVDARAPGAGASGHGAGLVSAFCREPLDARLVLRSLELYREAGHLTAPVLRVTGHYVLARGEETRQALAARARVLAAQGVEVEELSPARAARQVPHLRWDDVLAAFHMPGDGVVDPGAYCRRMAGLVAERGARVLAETRALRVALRHGRIEGLACQGEAARVVADVVVLATGVWTRPLLRAAGLDVPLKPYRTQLSFWRPPEGLRLPPVWDPDGGYYGLERDGLWAVGDGTEEREADPDAFDPEPDPDFLAAARRHLEHRCPAAAGAELVRGWAHLCDATPDRRPLLGRFAADGLYLAVGFNGFGVMRAPAVGEALAAQVLGRPGPVDVSPYRPDRFADADPDFPIREGWTVA